MLSHRHRSCGILCLCEIKETYKSKFAERFSKVENHKLKDNNVLIDFNKTKEITVPGMNDGTGMMTVKMYMDCVGQDYPVRDS